MAKIKKKSSNIVPLVLMVVFGLLALIIGYTTWKGGSLDLRSKAATEEIVVKQWTFDKTKEGWNAKNVLSFQHEPGGMVVMEVGKMAAAAVPTGSGKPDITPVVEKAGIATPLLYSSNQFRIRLTVTPGVGAVNRNIKRIIPASLSISYRLKGKQQFDSFPPVPVTADGSEHDYVVAFPGTVVRNQLNELSLKFPGLEGYPGTKVQINDIKIFSKQTVVGPTPSCIPRPTGATGWFTGARLAPGVSFCPENPKPTPVYCPGPDGTKCETGICPQPSCEAGKPCPAVECRLAFGVCKNNQCVSAVSTTPSIPAGCYYKQVQCITAPCDPILVCPTNYPTPVTSCVRGGCNGELCNAKGEEGVSACVAKPEFACYTGAQCELQKNGTCGWTQTRELTSCLSRYAY